MNKNTRKNLLALVMVFLSLALSACGKDGGSVLDLNPVEIGMEYIDDKNPCGALEFNPECK